MMNQITATRPARFSERGTPPAKASGPRRRRRPPQRRGVIFVIALAIIVVLTALLLVYAQEMRTEAIAAANQVAAARADAVEAGAEQWVMATCETFTTPLSGNTGSANVGFGTTDITTIPAAGLIVGDPAKGGGYFWCLSPIATDDQHYGFGIQDENAKANLNMVTSSTAATRFMNLPNVTQEIADCIQDWVDTDENPANSDGAESSYYGSLGVDSYQSKNGTFDTVDELLLVKNVTPGILYGTDLNRDGVIDTNEAALSNGTAPGVNVNGSNDRRGLFNYVTCYTTNRNPTSTTNTGRTRAGMININTAPEPVLMTLPFITQSLADTLVSARTQANITGASTDLTWAQTALGNTVYNQLVPRAVPGQTAAAPYITARSYQYSADIVAVSGDGRAFKRVRIVVDTRLQPAKIVYHKDLTDLGWPLPPDVRTELRAGRGVPQDAQGTTDTGIIGNTLP